MSRCLPVTVAVAQSPPSPLSRRGLRVGGAKGPRRWHCRCSLWTLPSSLGSNHCRPIWGPLQVCPPRMHTQGPQGPGLARWLPQHTQPPPSHPPSLPFAATVPAPGQKVGPSLIQLSDSCYRNSVHRPPAAWACGGRGPHRVRSKVEGRSPPLQPNPHSTCCGAIVHLWVLPRTSRGSQDPSARE